MILDIYRRKIVGYEVYESGDFEHTIEVLRRAALAKGAMLPEKSHPPQR